jgi:hypothetical protein
LAAAKSWRFCAASEADFRKSGQPSAGKEILDFRFWILVWKTSAAFFRLMANRFLLSGCWLLAADG